MVEMLTDDVVDAWEADELSVLFGQGCVDCTDMSDDSFFMNSMLAVTLLLKRGPVAGSTFSL